MSSHVIVETKFALPAASVFAFSEAGFLTGTTVGPVYVISRASTTEIINGLSETHHNVT